MTTNQFDITILNKEVKKGGLFFGTKTVIKEIKKGNISKIYLANDLIDSIKNDLEKGAKEIIMITTDLDKEHLKEVCKKPFNISVLGIQKGSEFTKSQESSENEEKEDSRKEIRAKKDRLNKARKELEEKEDKIEERKKISEKKEKVNKKEEKKK
ncbi:ribosomal L7Ae/L30e/S12e/Gadd45 family protein [Candidatus Pacearchaeota archaeon]|nr:ribosomal L7Ae/L30e/S12e/Gadd45 family protein [Candidatus Pacearchaeota archaeon]